MTETSLIQSISPARVQEILQGAGYRVTSSELNGATQLFSAAQGIGFIVRFGNAAQDQGEYLDYSYSCALQVQGGELPAGLVESWNATKRFARLARHENFLVLESDVVLAGGVTETHVRAMTELWDRLLQEYVLFLRQFSVQSPVATVEETAESQGIA